MSERKLWIIKLPLSLQEEMRIYSIRHGMKIWEAIDEAVEDYFQTYQTKGVIDPNITGEQENTGKWTIQISPDKYKALKHLAIELEVSIFDVINTALYRLLAKESND
ncbi:hypothetical protein LLE49_25845 [Alicyclobacillus tolerans]|uniref:hypothetical protein n=1 Tax=Alicyclobacillus tolerans TaxID=90970 RepID=UPI001F482D1A|nr:hypothetical protein [Alicyclobacillus tolerans]MCF8568152.1 hypothetical protein [Alicyclobacillus tolerans]